VVEAKRIKDMDRDGAAHVEIAKSRFSKILSSETKPDGS
jgi:hypothetical protein